MVSTQKRVCPTPSYKKTLPHFSQSIVGNEVKEQGFTDRVLSPTGLRCDAATRFLFQLLLLFFGLVIPTWLPTT